VGKGLMKESLSGRQRVELGQVMGHSGFKTGKNKSKFAAQASIQHYKVVQSHIAISWLAMSPSKSQTAHKWACHWAWE